jgi:hypothetical protein
VEGVTGLVRACPDRDLVRNAITGDDFQTTVAALPLCPMAIVTRMDISGSNFLPLKSSQDGFKGSIVFSFGSTRRGIKRFDANLNLRLVLLVKTDHRQGILLGFGNFSFVSRPDSARGENP